MNVFWALKENSFFLSFFVSFNFSYFGLVTCSLKVQSVILVPDHIQGHTHTHTIGRTSQDE